MNGNIYIRNRHYLLVERLGHRYQLFTGFFLSVYVFQHPQYVSYSAFLIALGYHISRSYPDIAVAYIFKCYCIGILHPLVDIGKVAELYSRLLGRAVGQTSHDTEEQVLHVVVA